MLTLHDNLGSGNAYKVRLILSHLNRPFHRIEYDVTKGETRTPAFLALNPNGRVPALQFEDGRVLAESNAILFHLAEGTPYLPADAFARAEALQWMFFEQYSHEPNIAVVRYWHHFIWDQVKGDAYMERALEERTAKGYQALDVMEQHLARTDFFAGGAYSIADIALYAYTHVAHEGKFELSGYAAIRRWLDRIADQPGHVLITQDDFA